MQLTLPQLCLGLGRALIAAAEITGGLSPDPKTMHQNIDDGTGLIYAEALSFALAARMPRPEAQAAVKSLCTEARQSVTSLAELTAGKWPDFDPGDLFSPQAQLGSAPADARQFAQAARKL